MSFDFERLFSDNNVPYKTNGSGWLSIDCPNPNCKNTDMKCGCNPKSSAVSCFRCGVMKKLDFIKYLLNVSWQEAFVILKSYNSNKVYFEGIDLTNRPSSVELPEGHKPLNSIAKKYLKTRGFDPQLLESKYGFRCLDHTSIHPNRIVIPIYLNGILVSYTTRSYSPYEDAGLRYLSCDISKEVVPHKSILYNWDFCYDDVAVIVEGPLDAIKGSDGFVASFGIQFCSAQIRMLKKKKKIYTFFDNETKAQRKAKELAQSLSLFGISCENICLTNAKDPGELSEKDIKILRKELELE